MIFLLLWSGRTQTTVIVDITIARRYLLLQLWFSGGKRDMDLSDKMTRMVYDVREEIASVT
jgi:hypothetical protein